MAVERNTSTTITIDGVTYVYFGGTNYLGLAHRTELMQAAEVAFRQFGFSAGASRLTSGETLLITDLERELAEFGQAESSIVLPAGYLSNFAVVDALDDQVDAWIVSPQAHGSIKSALQSSKKRVFTYEDDDLTWFREKYQLNQDTRLGVFAEPIDPLTGDCLDLHALLLRISPSDYLILDEAHSFGVLGTHGIGALEHYHMQPSQYLIRTGTFSKALGTYGGFVLAASDVIARVKQLSNSYKASTALASPVVAATRESIRLLQEDAESTVHRLQQNVRIVNGKLCELGFDNFRAHSTPIYHLSNSPSVNLLRQSLPNDGFYLPSVSNYFAGSCEIGLRWTLQSGHTNEQLGRLLTAIERHLQPVH